MTDSFVGVVSIIVVILLVFLGMPVALSLMLVGFIGIVYLSSISAALTILVSAPIDFLFGATFVVIPLFVFMGAIITNSEISVRLFDTAYKIFGQLRGSLAVATVSACALFGAVCGSSVASAVTMTKLAYPQMEKYGYKPELAAGVVATGGTLAVLIPPSTGFVLYSILTEESLGKLFMAGIIPGAIQAFLLVGVIVVWTLIDPKVAPKTELKISFSERIKSLSGIIEIVVLFLLVIGGIFFGIFSVTEAAGVGAVGAVIAALARRTLTRKQFSTALSDTLKTTATLTILFAGGIVFSSLMSLSRIPFLLADYVVALGTPPLIIILCIMVIYIFMGAITDLGSMLIITIPIFYHLILALGLDPIWFGVLVVVTIEADMIIPPLGLNVMIISGMLKDVPIWRIYRGSLICFIANFTSILIIMAFPQVALFLPRLMK